MSRPKAAEAAFTRHLDALVEQGDRASLAALRRGSNRPPGTTAEVFPHVVPLLPPDATVKEQDAYELVAVLFATHQGTWRHESDRRASSNLGASFAWLARERESGSTERRFVALLNAAREDLRHHVRHAIALLKASDVPVDWAQLLRDVQEWDDEERGVQRAWARAFWGAPPPKEETPKNSAADTRTAGSQQ